MVDDSKSSSCSECDGNEIPSSINTLLVVDENPTPFESVRRLLSVADASLFAVAQIDVDVILGAIGADISIETGKPSFTNAVCLKVDTNVAFALKAFTSA